MQPVKCPIAQDDDHVTLLELGSELFHDLGSGGLVEGFLAGLDEVGDESISIETLFGLQISCSVHLSDDHAV